MEPADSVPVGIYAQNGTIEMVFFLHNLVSTADLDTCKRGATSIAGVTGSIFSEITILGLITVHPPEWQNSGGRHPY